MVWALAEKNQSWWQLSFIQIPGMVSLPFLRLSKALQLSYTLGVIISIHLAAGISLMVLGVIMVALALPANSTHRLNLVEVIAHFVGDSAARICGGALVLGVAAWFSQQLHETIATLFYLYGLPLLLYPRLVTGMLLGLITTYVASYGIRGIRLCCTAAMIPLALFLAYCAWTIAVGPSDVDAEVSVPLFGMRALPVLVAVNMIAVIEFPTFIRHGTNRSHSIIAVVFVFIFTMVTGLLSPYGILPTETNLFSLGIAFPDGHGVVFRALIAIGTALLGVAVNTTNIYAASVGLEALAKREIIRKEEFIILGLGSTFFYLLAQSPLLLAKMEDVVAAVIASAGAILIWSSLLHRLLRKPVTASDRALATASWTVGLLISFVALSKFVSGGTLSWLWGFLGAFIALPLMWGVRLVSRQITG